MSIPAPGVIWRIIEALNRDIDKPIGPISLTTSDADWLQSHMLSIVAQKAPREGKRGSWQSNYFVWVALDVAMRVNPSNPPKAVFPNVAESWGITKRQVERWESIARGTATQLLRLHNKATIERMVQYHRTEFLKKSK